MTAMPIARQDVEQVARLAQLQLTDEEATSYTSQLAKLLEQVKQLESVDVADVDPTDCVMAGKENVLRQDRAAAGLPIRLALANAPESIADRFRVPPVRKED